VQAKIVDAEGAAERTEDTQRRRKKRTIEASELTRCKRINQASEFPQKCRDNNNETVLGWQAVSVVGARKRKVGLLGGRTFDFPPRGPLAC
jgi:hypothetical protein